MQLHDLRVRTGRDVELSAVSRNTPTSRQATAYGFDAADIGKMTPGTIQVAPETPLEPKYELDLHIEKLDDQWKGLSNIAILAIQLNEFQRYLELGHFPSCSTT